jgi:hypothetical protein
MELTGGIYLHIVVPVHKLDDDFYYLKTWLRQAAESKSIEVTLIYDGVEDSYFQNLANEISNKGTSNINLICGIFGSPGGSRNQAWPLLKSRWTVFWDADDSPNPREFLAMLREADSQNYKIAIGDYCSYDYKQKFTTRYKSKNLASVIRRPGIWRWGFRTELVENHLFPDSRMGEDQVFLISLGIDFRNVYKCERLVYQYNIGDSNQLTFKANRYEELLKAIDFAFTRIAHTFRGSHLSKILLLRMITGGLKNAELGLKKEFIFRVFIFLKLILGGK